MLVMTKAILALMIGFIVAVVIGLIVIPILKKINIKQVESTYLSKKHKEKSGTPTMGGIIFILSTLITMAIFIITKKVTISTNLLLVLFIFLAYALIGFIDDFLIIKRKNNIGLTEIQKLVLQGFVALVFYFIYMHSGAEAVLEIHTLGITINMGWFYAIFIMFMLLASSNAVNITDGLDGLAGGLSLISFLTFGIIAYNTTWLLGYIEIAYACFIITGALFGFLLFNMNPAKIFMGDTGSLALGATLGAIAILTRHELLLVLIGIVFVIETLSCIIQRFYYKLTHKRLFLMTPIHHSFEKKGYKETDIVKSFWLIGLLASMVALAFGVLL